MALYHVYSQTVADGTATSVVRPSDWNSAHSQVMTLAGNTAGASTISGTNLVFQGGNNVTLSVNQGANVGTVVVSAASQTVQTQASGNIVGSGYTSTTQAGSTVGVTQNSNGLSAAWPPFITTYVGQTTQTQPAGNIVGAGFTSTTTAGTAVVATQNSNGLSMGVPAYLTTAAQSNHSHNFATTTTNGSQIVVGTTNSAGATIGVPPFITTFTQPGATVFSNSNNVSFGLNGSTITATATFAQSAQTANLYANGNTTQLSSTAGVDVRSLSFEGAGIASVGVSAGRVLVSVPSGGGGGDGYNIVQMGTGTVDNGGTAGATFSTLSGSIYLQAGNNMTLSQTSNTINISGADVKWQFVGANTAGTTSSNLSANQFYFSGGNNVTLSGNSNTIVISAAAGGGGGGVTAKSLMIPQPHLLTTVGSLGTASASVQFIEHPGPLTWTAINIPMSVSVATTNNSSFAGQNFSVTYIIATQTGQTLNSVVSTTWSAFQAWQSNSTASVTGGRVLSTTWGSSLPGGDYYHILRINTANTGGGLTGVGGGTATTALGNTCSIMGAASAVFGAVTWGALGAATASSNGPWLQGGHGLNSSTGQLTNMSMSNVSKVGTFGQRALFGAIFLG